MDKYGYIGIETLLNFCENSKDHAVTPNDFMRMNRARVQERKTGKWVPFEYGDDTWHKCTACGVADNYIAIVHRPNGETGRLESVRNFCPNCGADMRGEQDDSI